MTCAFLISSIAPGRAAPPSAATLTTLATLEALIVKSGPYAGALRLSPRGGINWYFANVALTHALPALPRETRAYLDAYVRNLDPQRLTIDDVAADDGGKLAQPQPPDSHDAYAATFISLAVGYAETARDARWWRSHREIVKAIAYRNILQQIKPDGLVAVYQRGSQPAAVDPHEAAIGYLIDNCEVYGALVDLSRRLNAERDKDAAYYATFVVPLGNAIAALFDRQANAWRASDDVARVGTDFYPDCLAQAYPGLYAVVSGTPADVRSRDALSYAFLKSHCRPSAAEEASQVLTLAAYAARFHRDYGFAGSLQNAVREDETLPALAWRLDLVKNLSQ